MNYTSLVDKGVLFLFEMIERVRKRVMKRAMIIMMKIDGVLG